MGRYHCTDCNRKWISPNFHGYRIINGCAKCNPQKDDTSDVLRVEIRELTKALKHLAVDNQRLHFENKRLKSLLNMVGGE